MRSTTTVLCLACCLPAVAQAPALKPAPALKTAFADAEDRYWRVETVPTPAGAGIEVGGMDFLSDGRLVVSTRRGQVWIVDGALAPPPARPRFELFADGLSEGLGLKVLPGDRIFVLQRQELSELIDEDGDGHCDHVRCVTDDWGMSGNYHEFAFGLPVDRDGNFYLSLNLGFFDPYRYLGRAAAPWRGWVLRVSPDGEVTPWASGFRSPNGISLSPDGDLFVTDNQGDWVPACPVHHVERGRHYGHPASLDWRPDFRATGRVAERYQPMTDVPRTEAAVWLPHDLSRSTGNLAWDTTSGRFGPFAGQAFAAEISDGLVLRLSMEKVGGAWQGASFAFRPGVGAANRIAFAPDGSLLCGLTSRGWGGAGPAHGISRVRWTGEMPMEMRSVSLAGSGFEIEFTLPLADGIEVRPEQVRAVQYRYRYWWNYGSPEDQSRPLRVRSVEASADRRRLSLVLDDLRGGFVTRVELEGVVGEGDHALLHPRFDYTLARLRDGTATAEPIARVVPVPQTREQRAERAVFLSDLGNTLRTWRGEGWALCSDPGIHGQDPTRLSWGDEPHCLVRPEGSDEPLRSAFAFGDCTIRGEVMFAADGAFGLVLPNGAVVEVARPATAGTWQEWSAVYRAPAQLVSLALGDTTIAENLELEDRAGDGRGPIGLIDRRGGQVAFRNVMVTPDDLTTRDDGSLVEGGPWRFGSGGDWTFTDGVLTSTRGTSAAVRPAGAAELAFEADVRLAPGTRGALVVLCDERGNGGHEVRLNRSAPDPLKTGSLVGRAAIRESLVAYDDTWFRIRVEVRNADARHRVRVLVNGVPVADEEVDAVRARGDHVALVRLDDEGLLELARPWLEPLGR